MNAEFSTINCQLIGYVGEAKGCFVEAIEHCFNDELDEAVSLYREGLNAFNEGHKIHGSLLTRFANGESIEMDILAVHGQCQLMSAEDFKVLTEKLLQSRHILQEQLF